MKALRLFFSLSVGLLILDQLVKWWARSAAQGVEGRSIWAMWPGVFELKLVYNQGIAFGLFQGAGPFMAPVAIAMAVGAGWYSWKHRDEPAITHVTTGLLAAGAIGNLIDRLWMGKVTDMFWIRLINFPVFNIADICITFCAALLIVNSLRDLAPKKKPAAAPEPEPSTEP